MDRQGTQGNLARPETDDAIAMLLEQLDPYIIMQGEAFGHIYAHLTHPAIADLEVKEIIQKVRIRLWRKLLKQQPIKYHKSYIQRMVRNAFIDATRQKKFFLPLLTDENGEIEGTLLARNDHYTTDPASLLEQRVGANELVNNVVEAIAQLPERQKLAIICRLRERVDDLAQLDDTFKAHHMNVESINWPLKANEKQLLKASLPPARKEISKHLQNVS